MLKKSYLSYDKNMNECYRNNLQNADALQCWTWSIMQIPPVIAEYFSRNDDDQIRNIESIPQNTA